MSAISPADVFIAAHGRSGSTLLQNILNAHPGVLIRGKNGNVLHHLFLFLMHAAVMDVVRERSVRASAPRVLAPRFSLGEGSDAPGKVTARRFDGLDSFVEFREHFGESRVHDGAITADAFEGELYVAVQRLQQEALPVQLLVDLLESPVDLIESPVDLLEALVDLLEAPVDLIESLVDLLEALVDLLEAPVDLLEASIHFLLNSFESFENFVHLLSPATGTTTIPSSAGVGEAAPHFDVPATRDSPARLRSASLRPALLNREFVFASTHVLLAPGNVRRAGSGRAGTGQA